MITWRFPDKDTGNARLNHAIRMNAQKAYAKQGRIAPFIARQSSFAILRKWWARAEIRRMRYRQRVMGYCYAVQQYHRDTGQ